jgi:hypothetical protein
MESRLARIENTLLEIKETLGELRSDVKHLDSHSERIGKLERSHSFASGTFWVIGSVAGSIGAGITAGLSRYFAH